MHLRNARAAVAAAFMLACNPASSQETTGSTSASTSKATDAAAATGTAGSPATSETATVSSDGLDTSGLDTAGSDGEGDALSGTTTATPPEPIHLLSYNIRWGDLTLQVDGQTLTWDDRRAAVVAILGDPELDVVGLQEAMVYQVEDILADLPQWAAHSTDVEFNGVVILYRPDRFDVSDAGRFWFSETPERPSSFLDGQFHVCAWIRLVDIDSATPLYVYDLHWAGDPVAREASALLLIERVLERRFPDPVIVTGDFNARETHPPMQYLTGQAAIGGAINPLPLLDSFREVHPDTLGATVGAGPPATPPDERIDFILTTPGLPATAADIDYTANTPTFWASDHYPVTAAVEVVAP